jgi:hypothetical protein
MDARTPLLSTLLPINITFFFVRQEKTALATTLGTTEDRSHKHNVNSQRVSHVFKKANPLTAP